VLFFQLSKFNFKFFEKMSENIIKFGQFKKLHKIPYNFFIAPKPNHCLDHFCFKWLQTVIKIIIM
jgi:hypothetical protein